MRFVLVASSSVAIYVFLILMVRMFGRRQLGQLTPIDLLVIILLGSCVETALIRGDTGLRAGLVSAATLLLVNRGIGALFAKSRRFRHWAVSGPVLVVHNGKFVKHNMDKLGLTDRDVLEALRAREHGSVEDVRFGVVEADGTINVVAKK